MPIPALKRRAKLMPTLRAEEPFGFPDTLTRTAIQRAHLRDLFVNAESGRRQTAETWGTLISNVVRAAHRKRIPAARWLARYPDCEVGEDESHLPASFMEVVGILIENYEDEHVAELMVCHRQPRAFHRAKEFYRHANIPPFNAQQLMAVAKALEDTEP